MAEQFVTDIRNEIDQLHAEQRRRHELTSAELQHEHALRYAGRTEMPHEQLPSDHTTPSHDPDIDRAP